MAAEATPFGERLTELRERAGLTQEQVAGKCNSSPHIPTVGGGVMGQ